MAREALISYEQVAAVADTMKSFGSKPTSRNVREKLGNVGSMGTINRHLQTWHASQEHHADNPLALPGAVQKTILDFIGQEISSAKTVLEAELTEQRQEISDLALENERQAATIEEKNLEIIQVHAELSNTKGRQTQLETNLTLAKEEIDRERSSAETARIELEKSLLRLEALPRLEADLALLRDQLQKERDARVGAEQTVAVLQTKLEAAVEKAVKAELDRNDAIKEAQKAREDAALVRGKHAS